MGYILINMLQVNILFLDMMCLEARKLGRHIEFNEFDSGLIVTPE